ncbi:MAG: hypothetical protein Q8K70_12650 [Bacteroidota bacterium]|nr:hypothetical protein [Bacteroidota bacterium]
MNKSYLSIYVLIFAIFISCKKNSDIKYFDDQKDWKILSFVERQTDPNTGAIISKTLDRWEFFRIKNTKDLLFTYNLSNPPQEYDGKYFEMQPYLSQQNSSVNLMIWLGELQGNGLVKETPIRDIDYSGATNYHAHLMEKNGPPNTPYFISMVNQYFISIRKTGKNKAKVIIYHIYPNTTDWTIELEKK